MNKKLLFAVAAIPAVIVAPTVVGAETLSGIEITGTASVNETLTASIANLPSGTVIKEYKWYYIEEKDGVPTKKQITGATQATYKLPAEAAGKTITVEATDTNGTKYESEPREVAELVLTIADPTFEGHSVTSFVAPGETVKVTGADVTDQLGAKLQSSQITYSYQWFYKVGEQFTVISGVTGNTYKVPADALEKDMVHIMVKATAKVGAFVKVSDFSHVLTVSNEASNTMMEDIDKLRVNDSQYNFTELEAFKAEVTSLESKYKALADAAKANVKNYAVLKRALADVEAISALNEKVNKVGEVDAKDMPKYLKDIEEAYDKFDVLQRSLDVGDALYNSIRAIMKDPTDIAEIAEVRKLGQAIVDLLNYDNNVVKYVPTSVESLQAAVDVIEADIAKLSKSYQATVQNQAILNEAKQDIKKIAQFTKLFDKLAANSAPDKQVTTAKSIRTAYGKLTYKQLQLVPEKYVEDLLNAENAEENQINDLNQEIAGYLGDDSYPINPTAQTWQEHVSDVNRIIAKYKGLTTNAKAEIVGYADIVTLQKDLKTADKVIKQIDAYIALTAINGVKENKLQSSYSSALKAYNKLTSLQQSLIYNEDLLLNNEPTVSVDDKGKEPADKAAAETLKMDIAKFADLTKYTFTQLETAVNAATVTYKSLSSGARKHVTNYHLLTAAGKDVKAVVSFHKKVQAAREETDVAKQAKKIASVEKAYEKLPANQQHLAKEQYQLLLDNRLVDNNAPNITTLDNAIGQIIANNLYTVTVEDIKNISVQYKNLSSSDKKQVTNASILKTAEADVKKVESFMKQYDKSMGSHPATVIKVFAKLTAKQMSLVSDEVRQKIIEAEQVQQGANKAALDLVESINTLLQNGVYKAGLQADVTIIRAAYDALSSSEKSVVKNYSKLTQAEADLKKVAEVHALYEAIPAENGETARKAWQTAYGKFSKKLELLYNAMYPTNS